MFEDIGNKLQDLAEGSTIAGDAEKGGDIAMVCDLADELRDAIVEYQVRDSIGMHTSNGSLIGQSAVRTTEGDVRTELHVDCRCLIHSLWKTWILIDLCRITVRHSPSFGEHVLTAQQLSCLC